MVQISKHEAGEIYSFRTIPPTEFSPPTTGRYGVLKMLSIQDDCVYHVALDGVFDHPPRFAEVKDLKWLVVKGRGPACQGSDVTWKNKLPDFSCVGSLPVTDAEMELVSRCRTYGPLINVAALVEAEWRRRNDPIAFENEIAQSRKKLEEEILSQRERHEKRLKSLTWEKLLSEKLLRRWDEHPPFPPPAFTQMARERIHQDILKLQALGTKPKRGDVRAIFKASIEWFNAKDKEFQGVIETEEREDLFAIFEELAFVARQMPLMQEIDNWAEW